MFKNSKTRKRFAFCMAVLCCMSILIGSLAFFSDRVSMSIKGQKAGTMDLAFTDISASKTGSNGITSNNGFAIDKAWENQAVVSEPNINPGDYFDLSYKLSNAGNKSMDVKQLLTVTCSVPMTDTTGYKLMITGEDYNTTAVAGTLSDDGYSITYELDDIILNGSGEGAEIEDGVSWNEQTYIVRLELAGASGNEFQGSSVSINMDAQAKQYRNTDDSVWSDWENYRTGMEYIDRSVVPVLAANSTWFSQGGTSLKRSSISSIEVVDWIEDSSNYAILDSAFDSWDASDGQVGTVTAYAFDDGSGNGTYKLTIAGNGYGCVFTNPDSSYAFSSSSKDYFTNLRSFRGADKLNTSLTTSLFAMFYKCSSLSAVDVSRWDTTNVTSLFAMFQECSSLSAINVSNWDTSMVDTMAYMFSACSSLDTLDVSDWDTSKVTTFRTMFQNCTSLITLDVSSWDTSSVNNMQNMFKNCTSLTTLDVSGWDTAKVTTFNQTFSRCSSLETIDVSKWQTSLVSDMSQMFYLCTSLTVVDVSDWDTSMVDDMGYVFYHCTSLTSLDVFNWDTAKVTTFRCMFQGNDYVGDMKVTPNVSRWDTSSATDMAWMFYGCGQITNMDLSTKEIVRADGTKYTAWDVSKVTTMRHFLADCRSLESVNFSNWNTSSLTSFNGFLNDCKSLVTIDVSDFDTANVEDFSQMFESCDRLTSIKGLDKFDTSSALYMLQMFNGSPGLKDLDLSKFNTGKVIDMSSMFGGCSGLETIFVSEQWSVVKVTSSTDMFKGCTALVGGAGTTYDSSHVDYTYAHIDTGSENPGYLTYKTHNAS